MREARSNQDMQCLSLTCDTDTKCAIHFFRVFLLFNLFLSHFYLMSLIISIVIKLNQVPTHVVRVKCICTCNRCSTPTRQHQQTYDIL